ncbi:MAG: hypothetical protein A3H45_01185 [Ignavibacteria bacterium RIFCSPLOWO2_02_FULL_55_14]|nr:MAG: hypothetical protein A3H45_01185 [Ignavibacteria bacterium RIFCSPLOWO2_02_FULL_55_14]
METVLVSFVTAAITCVAGYVIQERKLRRDFQLDRDRLRTEYMAEQVARELLSFERWSKRSFAAIKRRLGGFEDDELRKILVRAGAVRFHGDHEEELWGLVSRNREELNR